MATFFAAAFFAAGFFAMGLRRTGLLRTWLLRTGLLPACSFRSGLLRDRLLGRSLLPALGRKKLLECCETTQLRLDHLDCQTFFRSLGAQLACTILERARSRVVSRESCSQAGCASLPRRGRQGSEFTEQAFEALVGRSGLSGIVAGPGRCSLCGLLTGLGRCSLTPVLSALGSCSLARVLAALSRSGAEEA